MSTSVSAQSREQPSVSEPSCAHHPRASSLGCVMAPTDLGPTGGDEVYPQVGDDFQIIGLEEKPSDPFSSSTMPPPPLPVREKPQSSVEKQSPFQPPRSGAPSSQAQPALEPSKRSVSGAPKEARKAPPRERGNSAWHQLGYWLTGVAKKGKTKVFKR